MASPHLPPVAPTRVILVRHGRSTANEQGRYQGSSDESVLHKTGIQSARQLGDYLRAFPIDQIYTSPLRRARQTANILMAVRARGCESSGNAGFPAIQIHRDLREIDLAAWEGLSYESVRQDHPQAYRLWLEQPDEFELPLPASAHLSQIRTVAASAALATATLGSPSMMTDVLQTDTPATHFPVRSLYQRAQQFWAKILPLHPGQTLLLVSHGGTNQALIHTALGIPPSHYHSLQQSNCGLSLLEFGPEGAQLQQLNHTRPLGEALPKLKAGKQGLRLILLPLEGLHDPQYPQHYTSLSQRLSGISLDFCLALSEAQPALQHLLQHHPKRVQFSTDNPNFLADWQQALQRSRGNAQGLMTGLAIAPLAAIRTLLLQTLGAPEQGTQKLLLQPSGLSVIHYPASQRPVVQLIE